MKMRNHKAESTVQAIPLELPGLVLLEPVKHGDARGFFSETYSARDMERLGLGTPLVQDNHSLSAKIGTIRGLHFQTPPHAQVKLVRVIKGAIADVCVDIRHGSPTFGQHVSIELSAKNWRQLWVPEGFAHGFCTLEPDTQVLYKVSTYYAPMHDKGLAWDDPELAIDWPLANHPPVVSDKDRHHPPLADLPHDFEYNGQPFNPS
jgi:dTDP-4-dehydrorhamnose 3,5-epimerase